MALIQVINFELFVTTFDDADAHGQGESTILELIQKIYAIGWSMISENVQNARGGLLRPNLDLKEIRKEHEPSSIRILSSAL